MNDYFITWEIELQADTPYAAACEALRIMRDPESFATVFKVYDDQGIDHTIDLLESE